MVFIYSDIPISAMTYKTHKQTNSICIATSMQPSSLYADYADHAQEQARYAYSTYNADLVMPPLSSPSLSIMSVLPIVCVLRGVDLIIRWKQTNLSSVSCLWHDHIRGGGILLLQANDYSVHTSATLISRLRPMWERIIFDLHSWSLNAQTTNN